jgi:membrane protein
VVVGLFSLIADPATIADVMDRFGSVAPREAVDLLRGSLRRLGEQPSAGIVMTVVGFAVALWATTGAVTTAMTAINRAYARGDRRGFVRRRAAALAVVMCLGIALVLMASLLVLGPHLQAWVGRAVGAKSVVEWIWWTAQWPILIASLLVAFGTLFALSADREHRHWRLVSPGSIIASAAWLIASAAFALYAARFGSYNKTWGSLSGVIVLLTWLWLLGLALLYGAEVDAETDRLRQSR